MPPGSVAQTDLAPESPEAWALREGYVSGFVISFQGVVCGWSAWIEGNSSWRPGCMALDLVTGRRYRAEGGNYQDGAKNWVPA